MTTINMSRNETADGSTGEKTKSTDHRLGREQEFRFEVNGNDKAVIHLRSGLAEIFGTELMKGQSYTFHGGIKAAIYSYHGCHLTLEGNAESYISKETPMHFYLNVHGCLEKFRDEAVSYNKKGPVVMVCGPTDVGKSTLCRILLNYSARRNRMPVFVDLDVGQSSIGIPGTMGVNVIETPASIESGFSKAAPLLYNFGSTDPGSNQNLYEMLITKCADATRAQLDTDPKIKCSGVIINTCGWTTGGGFKSLKFAAEAFEADIVLVLDQEKLYNELARDLPNFVKTILVPKSGGVVTRTKGFRSELRDSRIREYFYGVGAKGSQVTQYYPHSFDVPFAQMKIYKIGAPAVPDSCLPIGMKADDNQTKVVPMVASHILLHHILALTFCNAADKNQAAESNIQGFVCVTGVDTERQVLTVLSPQPKPLPTDCIFLYSEIQFVDAH